MRGIRIGQLNTKISLKMQLKYSHAGKTNK